MGTSNKGLKKFSKLIFLGFPINELVTKKMKLVGNPIKKLNKNFSLDSNQEPLRVYITGGSQGSEFINQNIPVALNALEIPLEVRHQSGSGKSVGVKELYSNNITVEVKEFYDLPQDSIVWSHFIISRAGALSLSEAMSLKRGSVMIPLPSAIDNHQLLNAINIVDLGMGLVHEEFESLELLSQKLKNIIESREYVQWSKKENNLDHFQAARTMLSSILKF